MKVEKPAKTEEVKAKIRGLVQQAMQEALESELDDFMGYPKHQQSTSENARNGHPTNRVQRDSDPMEIEVPCDRKSDFETKLIKQAPDSP